MNPGILNSGEGVNLGDTNLVRLNLVKINPDRISLRDVKLEGKH